MTLFIDRRSTYSIVILNPFAHLDPSSLMYAIQQQSLGSIQWTIIASGLKDTMYTISSLSKGLRYAFRVLTITSKAFSKPSPATDPVQLLDRGNINSPTHECNPHYICTVFELYVDFIGPYLQEAPVIVDKPEIVYVIENQSVTVTITLNHVNAAVLWKRYLCFDLLQFLPYISMMT